MNSVTIVIPNYNQTRFIANAIQSALNQTSKVSEIIVVDDGSTDNSREVIARFGNGVRYLWQENRGLAGARNTGIKAATTEFIGLLDADDEWQPNFVNSMLSLASQHPAAAVYYCMAQAVDVGGQELPQVFGGPAVPPGDLYHRLLRANFLIPSTILMRRSVIERAGAFDQSLRSCEDWDLWLRLLPNQEIVGTSTKLVRYRLHGDSLSKNVIGMKDAYRRVVEKHFGSESDPLQNWSAAKRRAYGGVHRYFALVSIQRQNDWDSSAAEIQRAFQIDPTLATDLNLFYELALGNQPAGYRDSLHHLSVRRNATLVQNLLTKVFDPSRPIKAGSIRQKAYATAYHALGLVAYNSGEMTLARHFLVRSLQFEPGRCRDVTLSGNLLKSLAGATTMAWLRRVRKAGSATTYNV